MCSYPSTITASRLKIIIFGGFWIDAWIQTQRASITQPVVLIQLDLSIIGRLLFSPSRTSLDLVCKFRNVYINLQCVLIILPTYTTLSTKATNDLALLEMPLFFIYHNALLGIRIRKDPHHEIEFGSGSK